MKKAITTLSAALFAVALFAGNGGGEKVSLTVDTKKSKIFWTGKKVTGEHTGTLMIKSGSVELEDEKPTAVNIVFDLTTIVCTDLKDADTNAKLVGHLKSDDFFSVAKHPTGTFKST
ncbi:MAG: YceI family protein [Flavobacteriales bacterium]|nr:YceI family protein [Flavobacteriales bacterium]